MSPQLGSREPQAATVVTPEQEVERLLGEAHDATGQRRYDDAARLLQQALEVARRRPSDNPRQVVDAALGLFPQTIDCVLLHASTAHFDAPHGGSAVIAIPITFVPAP
jgi:hypothetical protein